MKHNSDFDGRDVESLDPMTTLRKVAAEGGSLKAATARFMEASRGPGKLSFPDFIRLRLFEPTIDNIGAFVGQRRNIELCEKINYRIDWFGMLSDKVAERSYLAAYGLPTIPFQAIYGEGLSGRLTALSNRQALKDFLLGAAVYPIFGKPVDGFQSLGAMALAERLAGKDEVRRFDGEVLAVDQLVEDIATHYPNGYVFQPFAKPHPAIRGLCGDRLATARFLTIRMPDGPRIARVALKIPAGANVADNFWRGGNLLAQVDMATGKLGRTVSGTGLETQVVTEHPDTKTTLTGFQHPEWEAMKALALEGAHLMRHMPLIGWDIACGAEGPVIVEMNATPDMFLVQFAERRGILDDEFKAFMDFQAREGAEYQKAAKASRLKL